MTHLYPDDSGHGWLSPDEAADLIAAAEIAYSEMAFCLQDIVDPRRRRDDEAWIEARGKTLAAAADKLQCALKRGGPVASAGHS